MNLTIRLAAYSIKLPGSSAFKTPLSTFTRLMSTQRIEFDTKNAKGSCPGVLCGDAKSKPKGVIIIHEWWGMNDQIAETGKKISEEGGFTTLVPDFYRGQVAADSEMAGHLMSNLDWKGALLDISAAAEYLKSKGCNKVGVMGFCMGGALSFAAAASCPEISASAPFYGIPSAELADLTKIAIPLEAHFGKKDDIKGFSSPDDYLPLKEKLEKAGVKAKFFEYDAGHAFTNKSGPLNNYNEACSILVNVTYITNESNQTAKLTLAQALKFYIHKKEFLWEDKTVNDVIICERGKRLFYVLDEILCKECSIGSYSDKHNLKKCHPCTRGYYQGKVGQTECDQCPVNYTTSRKRAIHNFECVLMDENGKPKPLDKYPEIVTFPYFIPYLTLQILVYCLPCIFLYMIKRKDRKDSDTSIGLNLEKLWKKEHDGYPTVYQEVDTEKVRRLSRVLGSRKSIGRRPSQNLEIITMEIHKPAHRLTQADIDIQVKKYIKEFNRKRMSHLQNSIAIIPNGKDEGSDESFPKYNKLETVNGTSNDGEGCSSSANYLPARQRSVSLGKTDTSSPDEKFNHIVNSPSPMLRRSVTPPSEQFNKVQSLRFRSKSARCLKKYFKSSRLNCSGLKGRYYEKLLSIDE
ncbi:DgyrCDS9077 [Dimorphilus gyrociliatus]|uniref:DgyrCDS9077 n=1 Tax=Dimorphilus gyrociliatus TaxID=2664684 RepID=A0A7I8VXI1_9ANNE|nr:DgyrCDS9077 [Dimorphilus gyrociliatus]